MSSATPRSTRGGSAEHPIYVGCASWSIPRGLADEFPSTGSHLERYSSRFSAVEINSTFYRSHRPGTYGRWAASVPASFRFAVKAPRRITHESRLADPSAMEMFLNEIQGLGKTLGPILFQLPPKLAFDGRTAAFFFRSFRKRFDGPIVCEPRHPSWFTESADSLLKETEVARVAADPAPVPAGREPGGWPDLVYFRLHGSPRKYYTSYSTDYLEQLTATLVKTARRATVWCIFDNTAAGAGTANALEVLKRCEIRT